MFFRRFSEDGYGMELSSEKYHLCILEDCGFQFEHKEHVHLILMYNCGHCID